MSEFERCCDVLSECVSEHRLRMEGRAELKRQILEEVLPDLHGYYDGRDVVEALRKRLEAL